MSEHTPEMKACEVAFKRLLAVDVTGGLQLVTGLFVGLVVELAKRNGSDPSRSKRPPTRYPAAIPTTIA